MTDFVAYGGLFLSALAAATVLPVGSEAALVGLLLTDNYSVILLVTVASVGNTIGSVINWMLGRGIERFRERSWFPASPEMLDRASKWYHRYGRWSLLASLVPVIGDPLTVMAGVLREPLWSFVLLVAAAKFGRYLVLTGITLNWV